MVGRRGTMDLIAILQVSVLGGGGGGDVRADIPRNCGGFGLTLKNVCLNKDLVQYLCSLTNNNKTYLKRSQRSHLI